jgi:hypothetical protein
MTLNSIRVVWSREEEELYKEVLRQHGRSMARLSAAFPAKCAPLILFARAPVMSVSACRFVIARHTNNRIAKTAPILHLQPYGAGTVSSAILRFMYNNTCFPGFLNSPPA